MGVLIKDPNFWSRTAIFFPRMFEVFQNQMKIFDFMK